MSDFRARIVADLDTSSAEQKLNALLKDKTVKVKADVSGNGTEQLNKGLKEAQQGASSLSTSLKDVAAVKIKADALNLVKDTAKEAVKAVTDLDTAMTKVSMTMTNMSNAALNNLKQQSIDMAKELSTYTKTVTDAVTIFANESESASSILNKSLPTVLLASSADMSASKAADAIQGIMNQFDLAEDQAMHVADTVEKLSSEIAVDFSKGTQNISEAIATSGSVVNEAGMSFERYASIVSATAEKTRLSGSQLGNAYKTIFSRISRSKDGETTDAEMSKAEEAFNSVGVSVRGANGDLRNVSDTLDDLSQVWGSLNKSQKSYIAEQAAGVRQKNIFIATMDTYHKALDLEQKALDSSGTALEINDKRADSIQGRIEKLSATMTQVYNDAIPTAAIEGFLDLGISIANVVDKLGLLQGAFAAVGVAGAAKAVSTIASSWTGLVVALTSPIGIASIAVGGAVAAISAAVNAYKKSMEEARQQAEEAAATFTESITSIDDYVTSIQDLRDKLDSGTLSEAEAYEAKKQLFDIQSQLQAQYGESAAGIDLVNGSLRDQISLVKELSASDAEEFLTKNLDGIKKAKREMTKTLGGDGGWFTEAGRVLGTFYNNGSDESNRIKSIAKKYKDNIQLDDMQDGTFRVRFVGDATQAESVLVDFMTDLRHAQDEFGETDALTGLFEGADGVLKEADKIIDKYKDIYESAKQARMISESYGDDKKEYTTNGKTETAVQWLEDYTNSIKNYNDALQSGDTSKISAARNEFEALDTAIQALLKDEDFAQYADMFEEIRNQLDEASITAQEFSNELTGNNLDDQTKSLKEYVEQLKELNMTDTQFADTVLSSLGENGKEAPEAIRQIVDAYSELYGLDASALKPEQIDSIAASLVSNGVLIKSAIEETATSVQTSFGELKGTLDDFEVILGDKKDDNAFRSKMDGYVEKLDALKEAIDKIDNGEQLEQSTIVSLMKKFPQLSQGAGRLEDKLKPLSRQLLGVGNSANDTSSLMGLFNAAIDQLKVDSPDTANALMAVRDGLYDLYNVDRVGDPFDALKSSLKEVQALQSALAEQKSNGYISSDTIRSLIAANGGYVDALQNSSSGMIVNTRRANELAQSQRQLALDIADANKAAAELSYQKNYDEMVKLAGSAEELNRILSEHPEGFDEIYALDSANNSLREQIVNWEGISAEIRGAMSLLSQYNEAQSSANASDNYNTVRGGLKNADELYKQGAITRDDFTSYALLIAKNGATIEEAVTEYADNRERMKRYLETETEKEGLDNFFTDAAKKCEELGTSWVKMNEETGTFEFNIDDMNAFADSMGVNTELAENFLLALKDYGYLDIDLSMIGDSFRESVESIDTSSADTESSIQGIIDRMGELSQAGVDVSSSIEPLESALQELSANGVDISGFV